MINAHIISINVIYIINNDNNYDTCMALNRVKINQKHFRSPITHIRIHKQAPETIQQG